MRFGPGPRLAGFLRPQRIALFALSAQSVRQRLVSVEGVAWFVFTAVKTRLESVGSKIHQVPRTEIPQNTRPKRNDGVGSATNCGADAIVVSSLGFRGLVSVGQALFDVIDGVLDITLVQGLR